MSELMNRNIETEMWREYDFGGRIYRIEYPKELAFRPGGSTHRIVDQHNVVHCVPAPGYHGCVLRWESKTNLPPVKF